MTMDVNPIQVQKYLKGADYPMTKDDLVSLAQKNGAPEDVIQQLQGMNRDEFNGPNAVTQAMKESSS
ncbi:MAG: DUF2795 domain-containing protein [Chloroflexota bacterium]|nr:DUF2795 domain-containing protein [Chloroflexota bacterium]